MLFRSGALAAVVTTTSDGGEEERGRPPLPADADAARLVEVVVATGATSAPSAQHVGAAPAKAAGEAAAAAHDHHHYLHHPPPPRTASFEVEGRGLSLGGGDGCGGDNARAALLPPSQRASSAGGGGLAAALGAAAAGPATPRAARHRLAGAAAPEASPPPLPPPCCAGPAWVAAARPGSALGAPAAAAVAASPVSFLTAALMAGALCFHSVLEGAAQGAQPGVADAAHIFVAVAAHKGLAAYALGAAVVDAGADGGPRFWGTVGAFAAATPLGIACGALLADLATGDAAAGVSALAAGTFVYVAAMEVIPRELGRGGHGRDGSGGGVAAKLGALCVGFGLMTLLAVWA